jgi:8-oxo-dGTP pyrophosphatase MutT (NUDIX family)
VQPVTRYRNSAKAIIVVEDRLLAVGMHDDEAGDFFVLPGGGQEPGESLHDTLRRECLEEAGVHVVVHDLCFVRDYIGRNHNFSRKDHDLHLVEFMFRCEALDPDQVTAGAVPDVGQTGVAWLPLSALEARGFVPAALIPLLREPLGPGGPRYLGDVA